MDPFKTLNGSLMDFTDSQTRKASAKLLVYCTFITVVGSNMLKCTWGAPCFKYNSIVIAYMSNIYFVQQIYFIHNSTKKLDLLL